jgi:hypothetical protein
MNDHRNSEIASIWDKILAIDGKALAGVKGKRGESTDFYKKYFRKKGIYVIRDSTGKVIYVGISGAGEKEGGLADRLYTHNSKKSGLFVRLAKRGITLSECCVAIHVEADAKMRRRIEKYGIAVFDPPGNVD